MDEANSVVLSPRRWISISHLGFVVPILVSIRAWSFQANPEHALWSSVEKGSLLFLLFLTALEFKRIRRSVSGYNLFTEMCWIFGLTFGSFFSLLLIDNQMPWVSLNSNMHMLYYLVYFRLHAYRIDRRDVLNFVVFVGTVWAVLNTVEQFTYPRAIFYGRFDPETGSFEVRAGIVRYMIEGTAWGMMTLVYLFNKALVERSARTALHTAVILVGVYYFGTRQVMFVALVNIVAILLVYFWKKGRRTEVMVVLGVLAAAAAFLMVAPLIFGKLMEITKSEANTDNVRLKSMRFFLFDYWPHWITIFLGNGVAHYFSAHGMYLRSLQSQFGMDPSDVGIVGTLHFYGVIYTLLCVVTTIRCTIHRLDVSGIYLNVFFMSILVSLPLSPFFSTYFCYPVFSVVVYLLETHPGQVASVRNSP